MRPLRRRMITVSEAEVVVVLFIWNLAAKDRWVGGSVQSPAFDA
jgi:hypothetical protein